jgi:NAD(P)-dependent dehydrogenase (short-subunit alcohol dehydrogenase family)
VEVVERVAVVTGANRGIGFEIVRQLACYGVRVVLTARDAAKGEAARERLANEGLDVVFRPLDVRDADQARAVGGWVERELGRLDILVNNAGVLIDPKGTRTATADATVLRDTLETNLIGALFATQACLPLMRARGYGRIVNISSELGQLGSMGSGTPAYRISKTALNALTRMLAVELSGTNVKVNAMSPGWVRSDMGGLAAPRSLDQGADTAVWLATLPDDGPSGGFFKDRMPIAW